MIATRGCPIGGCCRARVHRALDRKMEPAPHESVPPPDSAVREATAVAATGAPGGGRRGSLDTGMVSLWAKGAKTAATVGLAVASKTGSGSGSCLTVAASSHARLQAPWRWEPG